LTESGLNNLGCIALPTCFLPEKRETGFFITIKTPSFSWGVRLKAKLLLKSP